MRLRRFAVPTPNEARHECDHSRESIQNFYPRVSCLVCSDGKDFAQSPWWLGAPYNGAYRFAMSHVHLWHSPCHSQLRLPRSIRRPLHVCGSWKLRETC
eukprot:4464551-Amphidinium_carterae.1